MRAPVLCSTRWRQSFPPPILVVGSTTQNPAMSVCWSVSWSISPSVRHARVVMLELKTITLSVKMRILAPAHLSATGFGRVFGPVTFLAFLSLLLLPKCSFDLLQHCCCPPACDLGSRVSGLVLSMIWVLLHFFFTVEKKSLLILSFSVATSTVI